MPLVGVTMIARDDASDPSRMREGVEEAEPVAKIVVVGASAGTVWTRLNRVRAKLRPLLSAAPLSAEEVFDERR